MQNINILSCEWLTVVLCLLSLPSFVYQPSLIPTKDIFFLFRLLSQFDRQSAYELHYSSPIDHKLLMMIWMDRSLRDHSWLGVPFFIISGNNSSHETVFSFLQRMLNLKGKAIGCCSQRRENAYKSSWFLFCTLLISPRIVFPKPFVEKWLNTGELE